MLNRQGALVRIVLLHEHAKLGVALIEPGPNPRFAGRIIEPKQAALAGFHVPQILDRTTRHRGGRAGGSRRQERRVGRQLRRNPQRHGQHQPEGGQKVRRQETEQHGPGNSYGAQETRQETGTTRRRRA